MFSVFAPATTANIGPGFDVLGAALDFGLTLNCQLADRLRIEFAENPDLPTGAENLIWSAVKAVDPEAPPMEIHVSSEIPLARGLGSSAAAIAAGAIVGAETSRLDHDPADLFARTLHLEGHPDNLAPALFGGLCICNGDRVTRLNPPSGLTLAVAWPEQHVETSGARGLLSESVTRTAAVSNLAAISSLIAAFTGATPVDPEILLSGTADQLHQTERSHLMPETTEAVSQLRAAGVAAFVSGSGPSLVALLTEETEPTFREVLRGMEGFTLKNATFDPRGARVVQGETT